MCDVVFACVNTYLNASVTDCMCALLMLMWLLLCCMLLLNVSDCDNSEVGTSMGCWMLCFGLTTHTSMVLYTISVMQYCV